MRSRALFNTTAALALWALWACGDGSLGSPTEPLPPVSEIRLKDIVIPNLPSPYYHFDYDAAGVLTAASFAADLQTYQITYAGGRISEIKDGGPGSLDRLVYAYDVFGRVAGIEFLNPSGVVHGAVYFTYDGELLVGLLRKRALNSELVVDKQMSFTYYADGNVREVTEHYTFVPDHQTEATFVDLYENYDTKLNVDAFSVLHTEFFQHMLLLPVRLQKGNPARVTRTGDGVNYTVDYAYTFDASNRPITKN